MKHLEHNTTGIPLTEEAKAQEIVRAEKMILVYQTFKSFCNLPFWIINFKFLAQLYEPNLDDLIKQLSFLRNDYPNQTINMARCIKSCIYNFHDSQCVYNSSIGGAVNDFYRSSMCTTLACVKQQILFEESAVCELLDRFEQNYDVVQLSDKVELYKLAIPHIKHSIDAHRKDAHNYEL